VSFGVDAHKWSLRRLRENPEIMRHLVTSFRPKAR
jgi:hypothetical protein